MPLMTSGQETERVLVLQPRARTGHTALEWGVCDGKQRTQAKL